MNKNRNSRWINQYAVAPSDFCDPNEYQLIESKIESSNLHYVSLLFL